MPANRCKVFFPLFILLFIILAGCQNVGEKELPPLLSEGYDTAVGRAVNPENSADVFYERDITKTKPVKIKIGKQIETGLEPGVPAMIEPVFPKYWEQDQLAIRMLTEVEELPLFSPFCVSAPQPKACSDRAYRDYLAKKQVEMDEVIEHDRQTVHWLRFEIDEQGVVKEVMLTNTWGAPCTECAEYALEWIQDMPDWEAARQDGREVSAWVEAPVVF